MAGVVYRKGLNDILSSGRSDEQILAYGRMLNDHGHFEPSYILHLSSWIAEQQEVKHAVLDDRVEKTVDFNFILLWSLLFRAF